MTPSLVCACAAAVGDVGISLVALCRCGPIVSGGHEGVVVMCALRSVCSSSVTSVSVSCASESLTPFHRQLSLRSIQRRRQQHASLRCRQFHCSGVVSAIRSLCLCRSRSLSVSLSVHWLSPCVHVAAARVLCCSRVSHQSLPWFSRYDVPMDGSLAVRPLLRRCCAICDV